MDRKIVEYLLQGKGINQIARELHVGKPRVRKILEKAKACDYLQEVGRAGSLRLPPYPTALFPDPKDGRSAQISDSHQLLEAYHGWIEERLQGGWHAVTVFEELPVKVGRSSFYRYLDKHQLLDHQRSSGKVIAEIVHQPGEALLLDWGKLQDVYCADRKKNKTLWMFVGTLGFSRYLLVRLVWDNQVLTTLRAIESMFQELGGVPQRITSDNPKCFALEASKYEPLLNPAMERFAAHYGTFLECLPPRDPQKKGKVERPMPYLRRLYEAHGKEWLSLEESQDYLNAKLEIANQRKHGSLQRQPLELFLEKEAQSLKPLPALAYGIEQYHEGLVREDGHVRFDNKYYSLDESYVEKTVTILANSTQVSIYHEGQLIEVHPRVTELYKTKATKPQHLKPWERCLEDYSVYQKQALALGEAVERLILTILQQEQGFMDTRKIWGILSLDKKYPASWINEACQMALDLGEHSYRVIKNTLEAKAANLQRQQKNLPNEVCSQQQPAVSHRFVRSLSVYREQLEFFESNH